MSDAAAGAVPAAEPGDPAAEVALLDRFAPFYDLEYGTYADDLDFYQHYAELARPRPDQPARVLDLACGTGRVLLALAAAGHLAVGIDASPAMLAVARARTCAAGLDAAVQLVEARMEHLPPGLGSFRLAVCALNSFAYLRTQADQLAMLAGVRGLLTLGGLLLLDLTPVDAAGPFPANGELIHQGTWARPDGGQVQKFVAGRWDPAAQQHAVTWIYDETDAAGSLRRTAIAQTLRYTYRWEAQLLLELAGFRVAGVYGSYDLDPYAADSPRLLLVAHPVARNPPPPTGPGASLPGRATGAGSPGGRASTPRAH